MKTDRKLIHGKYDGHCAYCGDVIELKNMQVDHIIGQRNFDWHLKNRHKVPAFLTHLNLTDLNHIDNLMPSCRSCNRFKSTFDLELFRSEVQEQVSRLRKYKPTFNLAERYGLLKEIDKPVVFYFETFK